MLLMTLPNKISPIKREIYGPKHKNLIYFLVHKSSTYTGLDCVKKSATNISRSGPFKSLWPFELEVFLKMTYIESWNAASATTYCRNPGITFLPLLQYYVCGYFDSCRLFCFAVDIRTVLYIQPGNIHTVSRM